MDLGEQKHHPLKHVLNLINAEVSADWVYALVKKPELRTVFYQKKFD